jgi:hypothetical protein
MALLVVGADSNAGAGLAVCFWGFRSWLIP